MSITLQAVGKLRLVSFFVLVNGRLRRDD